MGGGFGDDFLSGGAGNDNDKLFSGAGDDGLIGGEGDDELYGGDGSDYLDGGTANDHLDGGDGDDTFTFALKSGHDTVYGGTGADTVIISDFLDPTFTRNMLQHDTKITWMDFELGADQIRVVGLPSADTFEEYVNIRNDNDGNAVVSYAQDEIMLTLVGIDAQDLTMDDFSF